MLGRRVWLKFPARTLVSSHRGQKQAPTGNSQATHRQLTRTCRKLIRHTRADHHTFPCVQCSSAQETRQVIQMHAQLSSNYVSLREQHLALQEWGNLKLINESDTSFGVRVSAKFNAASFADSLAFCSVWCQVLRANSLLFRTAPQSFGMGRHCVCHVVRFLCVRCIMLVVMTLVQECLACKEPVCRNGLLQRQKGRLFSTVLASPEIASMVCAAAGMNMRNGSWNHRRDVCVRK